jgi:hypothetical protein
MREPDYTIDAMNRVWNVNELSNAGRFMILRDTRYSDSEIEYLGY